MLTAILLLSLVISAPGQPEPRSVLLPVHEVKAVSDWYSADRAERIDGSWNPTQADLNSLEANLSQVSNLEINGWGSRIHINHPEKYFRQYVGVKVSGQNRIFVNAFCGDKPPTDWHDRLFVVMDGATCFWQALYDPALQKFSNLRVNGRA
jgi:hypothetical protein